MLRIFKDLLRGLALLFLKVYSTLLLPFVYLKHFLTLKKYDCRIVLTSYPPRFKVLFWTILSLLSQGKPSKITVVLYQKDLPVLDFKLRMIFRLFKKVLSVYISENDLKSYKKILPLIQGDISEKYTVLCDDDIFYPFGWLNLLLGKLEEKKGGVAGTAGHLQLFFPNRGVKKYDDWIKRVQCTSSKNLLLTGAGGIAFKTSEISRHSICNYDFIQVCPNNDDLWIHYIVFQGGVFHTTKGVRLFQLNPNDQYALYRKNTTGRLDKEMSRLELYVNKTSK